MTNRPTEIKVGYLSFSIKYVSDFVWTKQKDLDQNASGLMEGVSGKIWVRLTTNQHESVTKEILLHEVLHAIFFVTSLYAAKPGKDWEEYTVRHTAPALLDVLVSNPELTKYLTSVS